MSKKGKQKVTIDGREYDFESFDEATRLNLNRLRIADQRIAQLRAELLMTQTARNVFARAIIETLPKDEEEGS